MPYVVTQNTKSIEYDPFYNITERRDIVVEGGAVYPTGSESNYVIPIGIPMSPVTQSTTGNYKPIRRAAVSTTASGGASALVYVECADGFAAGDTVGIFTGVTGTAMATSVTSHTIAGIDYDNNTMTLSGNVNTAYNTGTAVIEVLENGLYHINAGGVSAQNCCYLGDNIQTRVEEQGGAVTQNVDSPAVGYFAAQVGQQDLVNISTNALPLGIDTQCPDFDYVPTTPGIGARI